MTEETDPDFGPITSLGTQADEIIDEETEWFDLVEKLDTHQFERRDGYPDWHDLTPFRRVFLAYVWAKAEDISLTTIPSQLEANPELATTIGFNLDDLPSESTFKPTRLDEGRFEELQSPVESGAEEIRLLAAERGAPIGNDLLKTADDEDKQWLSNRTVQRLLRKKGHQVLDELKSVAIPSISLSRSDDAIYDDDELLVLEAIASIKQKAAHDSGQKLGDMKNPDSDLDDPFYEDGPSGETLLEALKQMSIEDIATVLNFALRKTDTRAKPRIRTRTR